MAFDKVCMVDIKSGYEPVAPMRTRTAVDSRVYTTLQIFAVRTENEAQLDIVKTERTT